MDDYADYRMHCLVCNHPYRPKIKNGMPIEECDQCGSDKNQTRMM